MKTWQKGAVGLGLAALVYTAGKGDGENPAPPGGVPESVQEMESAKTAVLGHINAVTGFGQGLVGEAGELTATAGNAASGAGNSVSSSGNTVPGAPPK